MWLIFKRKVQHSSFDLPETEHIAEVRKTSLSPDLANYFTRVGAGEYSALWSIEVNLFDLEKSEEWTQALLAHPIIQAFDGRVLDDPDTSNHHIYLNHAALRGCVLFLSHDGDTRIVYPTLDDFLIAVNSAKREECYLSEIHPTCSPVLENQAELSELISFFYDKGNVRNEAAVLALIPSMDLRDEALLARLAVDPNFFFGEAVAIEIEKRPTTGLRQVAELCSSHADSQVRNAGKKALAAILKLSVQT